MVYGAALEKRSPRLVERGFESHPLRQGKENTVDKEKAKNVGTLMIIGGSAMALHHRLSYGRWCDKDEEVCHGKAGLILAGIGLLLRLTSSKN